MAFKMKGSPLHYGTSSHKSALKHNSDELTRAQKNNGADWKHDEGNHDHKDGEIYDPQVTTTNKDGSTNTTQNVRKLGADSTECEKGFHKNKDGKCIKDEPTGKSDFDFKKTCHDKDGNRLRTDPRCKWADETEGKEVDKSTPDSARVIESKTTVEKEKGCVKKDCKEDTSVWSYSWSQEKCKCIKTKKDPNQDCIDRDKKEKACKGPNRRWSSSKCRCEFTGDGIERGARNVGKGIKAVGRGVKKMGQAVINAFKKRNKWCAAYASNGDCAKPGSEGSMANPNYDQGPPDGMA